MIGLGLGGGGRVGRERRGAEWSGLDRRGLGLDWIEVS